MTRFGYVMVTYFCVLSAAIGAFIPTSIHLVWNVTPSVPVGLYGLSHDDKLAVGDLVAVLPEQPLSDFMVGRGYIGRDVPLMKHVAALPGQQVCRTGHTVTVDGAPLGDALDRDRRGRGLPVWQGCRHIADGEVFLMNPAVPDSLDGRYFGPIPARSIVGKATPIYTDETGDGHFVWRPKTETEPR